MKPFYRLLKRGANCVGVAVGVDGTITLVTEISGRQEAVETFVDSVPKISENADEWFYALNDLLPMTYKIGDVAFFDGDTPPGDTSKAAAQALGEELIVVESRSSRLQTTRVTVSASIEDGSDVVGSPSKLKGREEEEALEEAEAEVADADVAEERAADEEIAVEPEAPREPSPEVVVVATELSREPLSIADDGAGVHENWYILLEDWQGLAAVFAGNREEYYVLSRSGTKMMSDDIAGAVPSEAANLEHWVTMLIRSLPAGVWLRSFTSLRSVIEEVPEAPRDMLTSVIEFFGTPAPERKHEFFGSGVIDGSLTIDPKTGEASKSETVEEETADA